MIFFQHYKNIRRSVLLILLVVLCFVASGMGVLALPKKTEAFMPVFDIKQMLNNILVALWKVVVFPLIKKIVIGFITTGEFPMNMDEFKTWLYEDLAFQAIESVLNEFGNFSLCARFSMNVRVALSQNELAPDQQPECTYDNSQLAQMVDHAVRAEEAEEGSGGEAFWDDVNNEFLSNFTISAQGSSNQYGAWFDTQERVHAETSRTENSLNTEISANRGFLGQRDCSNWSEQNDQNGDGEMQENECPLQTTGESVAGAIEQYNTLEEGSIGSEVLSDLIALLGTVIDTVINNAISGGISAIGKWKSSQERSSVQEYRESRNTSQNTGENRVIEH